MRWCFAVLLGGCFSPAPPTGVTCGPNDQCPPGQVCDLFDHTCQLTPGGDGGVEPPDCALWTYQPELLDPCVLGGIGAPIDIDTPQILDTDSGRLADVDGGSIALDFEVHDVTFGATTRPVQVLSVAQFRVSMTGVLDVTGSQPLLIVSWDDVFIDGEIGANARGDIAAGGSDPGTCNNGPGAIAADVGGGGGGGLGGAGGNGGAHNGPGNAANSGRQLSLGYYGGCPGQLAGGPAGGGGGVVGVIGIGSLGVSGAIAANGGGGAPGNMSNLGGSGGGAGGLVHLEAATLTVNGRISANGGGGGGGEDSLVDIDVPGAGADGQLGLVPAPGGNGEGKGGGGGPGSAGAIFNGGNGQSSADNAAGGGGGGGGAGLIRLRAVEPPSFGAGELSPAPQSDQS